MHRSLEVKVDCIEGVRQINFIEAAGIEDQGSIVDLEVVKEG